MGAESLDADVLTAGELFDGERILVRHNYNLLYGLYGVRNEATGKQKILLLFPRLVATDPDFAKRFNTTCSRLRGIHSNGLLTVENFGRRGGRFCIEYEPFAGDCLSRWITDEPITVASQISEQASDATATQTSLGEDKVKLMMQSIGCALQRLHRQGIHHYNLTLTSVLFDGHSQFKLWGAGMYEMIGKHLFERLVSAGIPPVISKERRRLLDPVAGMSPEMRAGAPPDPRADIHGLAVIGYEFLTGSLPGNSLTPPSQVQPGISPHWDPTLLKALSKSPDERQETVECFLRELDGKKAKTLTSWQRQRNRWISNARIFILRHTLVLAAAALVVVAAIFFSKWIRSDQEQPAQRAITDAPIRVVRTAERATHILEIQPAHATVLTSGRDPLTFETDAEGKLFLNVPSERGRIRIQAAGYHTEDWILRDDGSNQPNRISVELRPQFTKLQMDARADSSIYWRKSNDDSAEWQRLGVTEQTGTSAFENSLPAGVLDLEVRHPHYRTVRFSAVEFPTDEWVGLKAQQELRPAGLHVVTQPPGATVRLNGDVMGQAPLRIEGLVAANAVELKVELRYHHPYATTISLSPGSWTRLEIPPLEPILRNLPIEVRASDGNRNLLLDEQTRFELNEEIVPTPIADGKIAIPLGNNSVRISHPDYQPEQSRLAISETQPERLQLTLQALPAQLAIDVHPQDVPARLWVNGREQALRKTMELSAGSSYELQVIIEGFEAVSKSLQPSANESLYWRIEPNSLQALQKEQPWTFPYSDMRFVWIPAGSFTVGSPRAERHRLPNESDGLGRQPEGIIQQGFWMSDTPITQAFYESITGDNPSRFKDPLRPVENLSWNQANAFAAKLTEQESAAGRLPAGFVFRLPTQLEWEFASRAGTDSPFSWGSSATPEQGNFRGVYPRDPERSASFPRSEHTSPVRSFEPNPLGLFDMHGNVWEFTLDNYNDRYPNEFRLVDWIETRRSDFIVIRGGSWQDAPERARSAARERMGRDDTNASTGLRLVIAPAR